MALATLLGCGGLPAYVPTAAPPETLRYPTPAPDSIRRIEGNTVLIKNAILIDGRGGPSIPGQDVLVADGHIRRIGSGLTSEGVPILDASGLTLLPGLITSHVHLQTVPGTVIRQDDAPTYQALQRLQLRAYLACGYTSVLDLAISKDTIERIRGALADGHPGPNFFFTAPFLTPEGGYLGSPALRGEVLQDLSPPVALKGSIESQIRAAQPLGPKGVKVTIEEGIEFSMWPTFDDTYRARIRAAAEAVDTRVYVHSRTEESHRAALTMKPHALVHAGFIKGVPSRALIEEIKTAGAYVISTAAISKILTWGLIPAFQNDPWIKARVPILQWQTATHPDSPEALMDIMVATNTPWWIPNWLAHAMLPFSGTQPEDAAEYTENSARAVKQFHDAGIPIVLGADEGNWPAFTTFFHGVSSQIELETLENAGFSPGELIVASTSRPAKMLGESTRMGTIEVGKRADLIIVEQNPLQHGIKALRTLRWTLKDGHAKSPEAWLVEMGEKGKGPGPESPEKTRPTNAESP